MKPSKEVDEQIDEILAVFANYDDSYEPGYEEGVLSRIHRTKQQLLAIIEQRERETMEKFGIKKGVEYKVYSSDKVIVLEALQKGAK